MSLKRKILRLPILGRAIVILYKTTIATKELFKNFKQLSKWVLFSKETTNYTYDLKKLNKKYLISFVSEVTGKEFKKVTKYLEEIEKDKQLRDHIIYQTQKSKTRNVSDPIPKFARRIGWYMIARITKPKIIIETGVDKGLGSCILTAALRKNTKEGFPGYYYGTDIEKKAGELLCGEYAKYGRILYGDSIESLKKFNKKIDLFIQDSDHSPDYEMKEYEVIQSKLNNSAIIIGDNCHTTDKLLKFALQTNRRFFLFNEYPKDHWCEGAAIGIAI